MTKDWKEDAVNSFVWRLLIIFAIFHPHLSRLSLIRQNIAHFIYNDLNV